MPGISLESENLPGLVSLGNELSFWIYNFSYLFTVILNYFSLIKHLNVKIPRMILSSSTVFSNHPLLASEAQTWFNKICKKSDIPPNMADPVSALRSLPVETLVANSHFARNAFRPIWDDITITYDPRQVLSDDSLWDDRLEQIVFGHCENEVSDCSRRSHN